MRIFFLFLCYCFLITSSELNAQTINYSNHTFRLAPVPKLKNAKNNKAKWGLYFWEFGDGHYKITEKPKVTYSGYTKSGNQEVSVQLVPYYTVVEKLPAPIKTSISVKKGTATIDYRMDEKSVFIESTANRELIPGHDIRLALHYKAPASSNLSEGYLAFFYNKTEEIEDELNISFEPFPKIINQTFHHKEEIHSSQPDVSDEQLERFNQMRNEYNDFVVFKPV